MAVVEGGKEAVTDYRVLARFRNYTHVECRLHTGRTHQIRVHMSHIGHPCLGDEVYSKAKNQFGVHTQMLHACSPSLDHPRTGERMTFHAPLPEEFETVLNKLRNMN
jgi:23S rRNA pseudouridine1911/1915/1917 synthase